MAEHWFAGLSRSIRAGVAHTYILHLNVGDYMDVSSASGAEPTESPFLGFEEYCARTIFSDRKLLVFYDRSAGFTFGGKTPEENADMELLFRKLVRANMKSELPKDPATALEMIEHVLTISQKEAGEVSGGGEKALPDGSVVVVIGFAETIMPTGEIGRMSDADRTNIVTMARLAKSPVVSARKGLLFLVTKNLAEIAPHVRGETADVLDVKISLPNKAERLAFLKYLLEKQFAAKGLQLADGITLEMVAHASAGMSLRALEDLARLAIVDRQPISLEAVFEVKKRVIEAMSNGVLRVVRPQVTFDDIGGLVEAKRELMAIAEAMRAGDVMEVPEGVMLMGPPGTGKTDLAEAFAAEAGIPMVDFGTIRDMWVGSSEQRQELALALIDELAPVIVRRDEADGEERRRGEQNNDSGVSNRLQRRELEFFSDKRRRGRVLLFRVTNRPDLMDPAVLRPGRSDLRVPVLPTKRDVEGIVRAIRGVISRQAAEFGRKITWSLSDEKLTAKLRQAPMVYTGAEIRALLLLAVKYARREGSDTVTDTQMEQTFADFLPSRSEAEYDYMTTIALAFSASRRLIPDEWVDKLGNEILEKAIEEGRERMKKAGKTVLPT